MIHFLMQILTSVSVEQIIAIDRKCVGMPTMEYTDKCMLLVQGLEFAQILMMDSPVVVLLVLRETESIAKVLDIVPA